MGWKVGPGKVMKIKFRLLSLSFQTVWEKHPTLIVASKGPFHIGIDTLRPVEISLRVDLVRIPDDAKVINEINNLADIILKGDNKD